MIQSTSINHLMIRIFLTTITAATLLLFILASAIAAPGAHGPNGEHLDGKSVSGPGATSPRMEAKSDLFELVATLHSGELSILIDRYETNEPVLNAELEVESGGRKAKAKFHADHGDYAVDDPAFLKILMTPGEHAIVFTLVAGKESDLLDGTLTTIGTAAATDEHGHSHDDHDHEMERAIWIALIAISLGVLGAFIWWRRRRLKAVTVGKGAKS